MTVAGDTHITIDGIRFLIDKSVEGHYVHSWENLTVERVDITGRPGKEHLREDSLMWSYDDWSGGEGNRVYYASDETTYDVGYELNPRIRGMLTGRPNRARATVPTNDETKRALMVVADSAVWVGNDDRVHHSVGSPSTWTNYSAGDTGLSAVHANYYITAMTGDQEYMYYAAWHSGSSGSRLLMRIPKSGTGSQVQSEVTSAAPYAGLAIMGGRLYAWTGRRLHELDIFESIPLASSAYRKVYDTGVDPVSTKVFSATWWADVVATENSVIFWYSNDAQSAVYEYKYVNGVGRASQIWSPPYGFTIKGSAYEQGIVYFSGHWGGDENASGRGALYALPLDSRRPLFLKYIRANQGNNLQMQAVVPSYGNQVIVVAERTGRLFVYDAETDGLTMLDDLERSSGSDPDSLAFTNNDHRVTGGVTWGPYRMFVVARPGGGAGSTLQIVSYDDDQPDNRETGVNTTNYTGGSFYFDTPLWDYDFPMERKDLVAFHLTFKPLVSGQFIDVSYELDESGSYTSLTQITSATSGASAGRVVLLVSDVDAAKQFYNMRYRVTLTSSTGVATPILYAVTAEAKLLRKRETWDLVIRVKDEVTRTRVGTQQNDGGTIRDRLETIVENNEVVNFVDGYRYKTETKVAATQKVMIVEATDVIEEPGEGSMRVRLIAVPTT